MNIKIWNIEDLEDALMEEHSVDSSNSDHVSHSIDDFSDSLGSNDSQAQANNNDDEQLNRNSFEKITNIFKQAHGM